MDSIQIVSLVGAIVVICEAVKKAGLQSKFVPLLSILLGVVGAFAFGGADLLSALSGILIGLGTTLGYRVTKEAIE
jgi:hypothetical protein